MSRRPALNVEARKQLGLPLRGPLPKRLISAHVEQAESALVALLPRAVAVLAQSLEDGNDDLRSKVEVAHKVIDRVMGRAAPASVAPAERPEPIAPDDVHGQLQHLASLLTPSALEAIKSLVTNDLRQQGKLDDGEVEVGGVS